MIRLKIQEIARKKGISQSGLGRKADVDVKTMRRIYHDDTTPILTTTLDRLAKALGVDASELIESVRENSET